MHSLPTSPSEERPPRWANADGLPSIHVSQAALHTASLIDADGSPLGEARESYWHKATGGVFAPADLTIGEALLKDTGLIVEREGHLFLTPPLEEMLDGSLEDAISNLALEALCLLPPQVPDLGKSLADLVPDAQRREELLLARAQRFDDRARQLIGEIGEELVVAAARGELAELGREDLARQVRRVSLESDMLGYDVKAPRITGNPRLLEVKATTRANEPFVVHISRNEATTGAKFSAWAMVVCRINDIAARSGEICGWCPATVFSGRLPQDAPGGSWEQAAIELWPNELHPGLPLPTL